MFNWKKIFLISCCSTLMASCGKAPENTKASKTQNTSGTGESGSDDIQIIAPVDSGLKTLSVSFNTDEMSEDGDSLTAKASGWARVPEFPVITSGDALIVSTRVFINYEPTKNLAEYISLYCDYTSIRMLSSDSETPTNEQYNHYFKGCFEDVDQDGNPDEINFIPGDEVGIETGKKVTLKVSATQSSNEVSVSSSFELEYR